MEEIFRLEDNGYLLSQKPVNRKHMSNGKLLIYVIQIPCRKCLEGLLPLLTLFRFPHECIIINRCTIKLISFVCTCAPVLM